METKQKSIKNKLSPVKSNDNSSKQDLRRGIYFVEREKGEIINKKVYRRRKGIALTKQLHGVEYIL